MNVKTLVPIICLVALSILVISLWDRSVLVASGIAVVSACGLGLFLFDENNKYFPLPPDRLREIADSLEKDLMIMGAVVLLAMITSVMMSSTIVGVALCLVLSLILGITQGYWLYAVRLYRHH